MSEDASSIFRHHTTAFHHSIPKANVSNRRTADEKDVAAPAAQEIPRPIIPTGHPGNYQSAAEQQAQKHTRRADRELRQQRKADFPQTLRAPPRASRCARRASARPHVSSARGAPPPRRRVGARVERGSGARGATDRTREDARRRRRRARSARTSLIDCGGEEPPATHARRARRARVTRRSARAAPSLRTERRPKRRREAT